jgi:hypothetical protein
MGSAPNFLSFDCTQFEWRSRSDPALATEGLHFRTVMAGGGGLPAVHHVVYDPHHIELRHRHADNEVLSLYEGEVEVDGATHRAPAVLYVARGTLYGPLIAGPHGAKFFRVAYSDALLAEPVLEAATSS